MNEQHPSESEQRSPLDQDIKAIYDVLIIHAQKTSEQIINESEDDEMNYYNVLDQRIPKIIERDGAYGVKTILFTLTEYYFELSKTIKSPRKLEFGDYFASFITSLVYSIEQHNQTGENPIKIPNQDFKEFLETIELNFPKIAHQSFNKKDSIIKKLFEDTVDEEELWVILQDLANLTENPEQAITSLEEIEEKI